MKLIKKPRGVYDVFGEDMKYFEYITSKFARIAQKYDVSQVKLPIFESEDLYKRSVGQTSDIVSKEIYTFNDRKERSYALRPEGTAGMVRAYIENKLFENLTSESKYYYIGEMFRYERPQKGRQRQFFQIGVEYFNTKSIITDLEVILLIKDFLETLKLNNFDVKINHLGTIEQRKTYTHELKSYLKGFENELCSDCLERIEKNPLRCLDCKKDASKEFMKQVPVISDFYDEAVKKYLNQFTNQLEHYGISYHIDERLVRGLDYYTGIIFEFVEKQTNLTYCGGGRYDNLVAQIGGPDVGAIGFAFGLERLIMILKEHELEITPKPSYQIITDYRDEDVLMYALNVATKLREGGLNIKLGLKEKSLKAQFRSAKTNNCIIIKQEERANNNLRLKLIEEDEQVLTIEQMLNLKGKTHDK